eukprot:CAMPEP_0175177068 /NCGR_PEP_ID=MMETSP0087-20121206/34170_1 /TAXON_ID=136419 /ORGANISM="Unknown Unknown, Strain D1" /LENGTH=222 /DNA_ID=CAMNT_0016468983 /DNA_START=91 /DNA_END=756 /DNA_ORIENTATION=+
MKGGTNAAYAPQIDYCTRVFGPTVKRYFGLNFDLQVKQRGFFPKGGGVVELHTVPTRSIPPVCALNRGKVVSISCFVCVCGLPEVLAGRMAKAAHQALQGAGLAEEQGIRFVSEQETSKFPHGVGCVVTATTESGCILAGSSLCGKDQKVEEVCGRVSAGPVSGVYGSCVWQIGHQDRPYLVAHADSDAFCTGDDQRPGEVRRPGGQQHFPFHFCHILPRDW